MDNPTSKKTLKIESIQIKPIKVLPLKVTVENILEEKHLSLAPIDILGKLKTATEEQTIKKVVIQKKVIQKRLTKKKLIIKKKIVIKKKVKPKAKIIAKVKIKKLPKKTLVIKTLIASKKELPQQKNKPIQKRKKLSRKKEVALYNQTYADTLEVVNISNSFEIQEKNTLPDSHYFEALKSPETIDNNTPLEFVEKLGVVIVSDKYESNFVVPKKVEIAEEGIINFSSTSIETKELQRLEFVDTLGVIEISEDFETINAKKYLD